MSTVFDSVADTRPRVRRDVLFTDAWDGVLFHNSSGGFRISSPSAYKLASLLIPHLNGRRTVAELCAKLPDPQREMVGQLVSALLTREFARDIPADEADPAEVLGEDVSQRFVSQIGYIDHFVARAPQRFATFRDTVATVIGSGPIADACATGLIRNGMAHVMIVGRSDGGAAAEAAELESHGISATVSGVSSSGVGVTWSDLAETDIVLIAGGDAGARLTYELLNAGVPEGKTLIPAWQFGRQVIIGPASGADYQGCWYCAMLRLAANDDTSAAADIWRGVAVAAGVRAMEPLSGPLAAMIGNLLAFEVFRITTGALPAETDGKVIVQHIDSLDVVSEPLLVHPRCVHCRPETPRIAVGALVWDVPPIRSVIDDDDAADAAVNEMNARQPLLQRHVGVFQTYDDDEWDQTPVKVGTVRFTDATGTARRVSAFDLHHVVGARMRALGKAAITYADRIGSTSNGPVIAVSLMDGSPVDVARAQVEPFGVANADRLVEPTRAGAGAGVDQSSAIRDALGSALSYAALRGAIAGAPVAQVTLDALEDAELRFLAKSAANLGVIAELLDLGGCTPGGAYTLLARCADPAGGRKLWTLASDPSWRTAAVRTLCDLLGEVQIRRDSAGPVGPGGIDAGDGCDPVLTDFDPDTLVVSGTTVARLDSDGSWPRILEGLAANGIDPVVVPIGGTDLPAGGIHAVRVILTERRTG